MFSEEFRPGDVPVTAEQLALRKRVLAQAVADPTTFDMGWFEASHLCRTSRCIAGWAQYLVRGQVDDYTVVQDAITLLGLSEGEFEGGDGDEDLFWEQDDRALERLRGLAWPTGK